MSSYLDPPYETSFLQDSSFLQALNAYRVQKYFAQITLLDFETEHPIAALEGKVTAGSMNLNAGSPTRRTGSLTIIFDQDTFDLTNPDNLIAINRKVKIAIGIENPFYNIRSEWEYPPTLFFPQGVFIVTKANSSLAQNRAQISVNFIDKMGKLNGFCGGTIPAPISLHDRLTIDGDGHVTVSYPRIRQIIREVVHHFGDEHYSRIIISDLPDFGRRVVKWKGSTPLRFADEGESFIIGTQAREGFTKVFTEGDDVGYMMTELTYPGDLIKNAGATVTDVLDDIVGVLGNYEYFYDIDGYFHFQKIKHFMQTGEAPLHTPPVAEDPNHHLTPGGSGRTLQTPFNINPALDRDFQEGYLTRFSDDQFLNEFMNADLVSSVSFNPQYANIKNSFVVWGTRQAGEDEMVVRYHLAIDDKPRESDDSLSKKWVWEGRDADNNIVMYHFTDYNPNPPLPEDLRGERGLLAVGAEFLTLEQLEALPEAERRLALRRAHISRGRTMQTMTRAIEDDRIREPISGDFDRFGAVETWTLHSPPITSDNPLVSYDMVFEWREELYRMALRAWGTSSPGSYYDQELLAEWRKIYDPGNPDFAAKWREHFGNTSESVKWNGYRREVSTDPTILAYWLDIIDTNSPLGKYSVRRIGRRSVVEENNQINEVLRRQVPDVVFIDGSDRAYDAGTPPMTNLARAMAEQQKIGQPFFVIQPEIMDLFEFVNSLGSCYEAVRNLLHTHLALNASASINARPILYLDVNRIIRLNFPEAGVVGNFIINRLNWNLGGNPQMSINANEALVVV